MKFVDLKAKSMMELHEILHNTKREAMNLRFRKPTGGVPDTSRFKKMRRTVARIKTLMSESSIGGKNNRGASNA